MPTSFNTLPIEVQTLILRETLQYDPSAVSASTPSTSSLICLSLNVQQALSLLLVSQSCRSITERILYSKIRITKPSQLQKLAVTFTRRTDLAQLVTSLHLGPEDLLCEQGWPLQAGDLRSDWPSLYIETSLTQEGDKGRLPRWCPSGCAFGVNRPQRFCAAYAVDGAIASGVLCVDVELWRRGYPKRRGQRIGVRAWATRIFMLQGLLDMYLMEMRRIEDDKGYALPGREEVPDSCKKGTCDHYPRLKYQRPSSIGSSQVEGIQEGEDPITSTGNLSADNLYIVTSDQLWEHMARPDGPINHFDHLILYTGSSRQELELKIGKEWSRLKSELGGPHFWLFTNREWEDKHGADELDAAWKEEKFREYRAAQRDARAHRQAASEGDGDSGRSHDTEEDENGGEERDEEQVGAEDALDQEAYERQWNDEDDLRSLDISSEEREGDNDDTKGAVSRTSQLITLGRATVASTTNVKNLSLTGFFTQVLSSLQTPHNLLSLNLGPKARYWLDVLPNAADFTGLKRLRICGMFLLSSGDATRIAAYLPQLERLQWEMTHDRWLTRDIVANIRCLQGLPEDAPARRSSILQTTRQSGHRPEHNSEGAVSPAKSAARTTEVWLEPDTLTHVLEMASSTEIRRAWESGELATGASHRVKLIVSSAVYEEDRLAAEFELGRKWWEEGALRGGWGR